MKYLAVVAHPDDEALGCGGLLAKLADEGHHASVLLPVARNDPRGRAEWPGLLSAFRASCDILGATAIVPEELLCETEAEPCVHRLHDLILPWVEDADVVLTHWPGDTNQVHRGVSRAVEIATRPFRRRRDVTLFEVPTSTDQGFGGVNVPAFVPTEYVVLTAAHVARKREAVAKYSTEMAAGRTPEDVELRLRSRGAEIGVRFAEAYVVARRFR